MRQRNDSKVSFTVALVLLLSQPGGIQAMMKSIYKPKEEETQMPYYLPSKVSNNNNTPTSPKPLTSQEDEDSLKRTLDVKKISDVEIAKRFEDYNKTKFSPLLEQQRMLAQQLYNFYECKNEMREKAELPAAEFKAVKGETQNTADSLTFSVDEKIEYTLGYKNQKITTIKNILPHDMNIILENNFFYIPLSLLSYSSHLSINVAQLLEDTDKNKDNEEIPFEEQKDNIFLHKNPTLKIKMLELDDSKFSAVKSSIIKTRGNLDEGQKQLIERYLKYKNLFKHYKYANFLAIQQLEVNIRKHTSSQSIDSILAYIEGSDKNHSKKMKKKNRRNQSNRKRI